MLGIRFIKVPPTTYLRQDQKGRLVRDGTGLAFCFYGPTTSLVAVPTASNEVPFIFKATTADFQRVTIQGQITSRVTEPKKLAAHPRTRRRRRARLESVRIPDVTRFPSRPPLLRA